MIKKKQKIVEDLGRKYTVSIALPGSILENCQSGDLRTYLAGQIARAATVFNIDKIIIFSESENEEDLELEMKSNFQGPKSKNFCGCVFLKRILEYLETPQYLRKHLFPFHSSLKYAGLLNPVDSPHHMRIDEIFPYREGVVINRSYNNNNNNNNSFVDIGLKYNIEVEKKLPLNTRVTVQLYEDYNCKRKMNKPKLVSPIAPRRDMGIYWGYQVEIAHNFSDIFSTNNYDYIIGTSEHGEILNSESEIPHFNNLLIVFGGKNGLEYSLEMDKNHDTKKKNIRDFFNVYYNTCPAQGSRTIRCEEAVLISLSRMYPIWINNK